MEAATSIECADWRGVWSVLLIECVHIGNCIEEAFRPQEVSSPGAFVERQAQCSYEWVDRVIAFGAVVLEVPRAAFTAKAIVHGNGFEQSRFAGAVFASEVTDSRAQHKLFQAADGGNREWIGLPILNPVTQEFDFLEHKALRIVRENVRSELYLQLHQLRSHFSCFNDQPPYTHWQVEAAWARAAGIEIEHAVLLFHLWLMAVAVDHDADS